MAMFGKRDPVGAGSSAAVLEAPSQPRARVREPEEEPRVRESQWPVPEPAPAGTLQRRRLPDTGDVPDAQELDSPYRARRESFTYRLRRGIPASVAGRIVGGAGLLAVLAVLAAVVFSVRRSVLHDPRFAVASSSDIQITGNRHLTRGQVLSVFGSDLERNIFRIPLAERRADLERLPWVDHATVMRLLPGRLRVAITERTPVAFVRHGSHIGLVDASGVLLDMPPDVAGDLHYSFPVITGLSADDPAPVRAARMEVYRRFMRDLDSEPAGSGARTNSVSEVDVSNPEDVKAVIALDGADVLVHFGDENFLERYKNFAQNLPQWRQQYPKLASVDTRYDSQFVLEMQAGSTVPLAGDAAVAAQSAAESSGASVGEKKSVAAGIKPHAASAAKPAVKVAAKPAPVKKPILVHAYTPPSAATNTSNTNGQVKP